MKIPSQLVELGKALELDLNTWEYTWNLSDNMELFSNPAGNKLVIIYKKLLGRGRENRKKRDFGKAKRLYARFQGFKSDKTKAHSISDLKLKKVGVANFVCYRSDKWDKKNIDYKHVFDCKPSVYVDNDYPHVVVISSTKLRVTKRGIEG